MKIFLSLLLLAAVLIAFSDAFKDPNVASGRSVMVHLFEWKWNDIAAECERFLAPKGFAGVQISPPQEHPNINQPYRPWWQRYQPVSYKLVSRSGNEAELRNMVSRCNAVGVRIYVDAIINHMSATAGVGTAGSSFNAGYKSFPGVPFGSPDFNDGKCKTSSGNIENYNDPNQVRDCKLVSLPDLAIGSQYVRDRIVDYLNSLIDIGVAGFRIDAAKHMWPGDIEAIESRLNNLRQDVFGQNKRPLVYMEVIDMGYEPIKNTEYTHLGRVTEFRYGLKLSEVVKKENGQKMRYLNNFGTGWGFIPDNDALAFLDNHDNQRGHGGAGSIITYHESRYYKIANSFMLAWPYGFAQIMSSYGFDKKNGGDVGPPVNSDGSTKDVTVNPDQTCGNGWICEHRWRQITNMVKFRNVAGTEQVYNWWDNGSNQIAFSRGSRAFIAINNDDWKMDARLKTGLPAGTYCDVNSGDKVNGQCTGRIITVSSDSYAQVNINAYEEDPIIAIHVESRL